MDRVRHIGVPSRGHHSRRSIRSPSARSSITCGRWLNSDCLVVSSLFHLKQPQQGPLTAGETADTQERLGLSQRRRARNPQREVQSMSLVRLCDGVSKSEIRRRHTLRKVNFKLDRPASK